MRNFSKAPLDKCPYCGYNDGFYTKEQVHGTIHYNYNFDGSETDNSELYSHLEYTGGKIAYCSRCDKKLFKMSELDKG